jgi:hypothetical protein
VSGKVKDELKFTMSNKDTGLRMKLEAKSSSTAVDSKYNMDVYFTDLVHRGSGTPQTNTTYSLGNSAWSNFGCVALSNDTSTTCSADIDLGSNIRLNVSYLFAPTPIFVDGSRLDPLHIKLGMSASGLSNTANFTGWSIKATGTAVADLKNKKTETEDSTHQKLAIGGSAFEWVTTFTDGNGGVAPIRSYFEVDNSDTKKFRCEFDLGAPAGNSFDWDPILGSGVSTNVPTVSFSFFMAIVSLYLFP